jgi:DNA-directed RNA polymerase subunit E"
MVEKACKNCRRIIESNKCALCQDSALTTSWHGIAIIFDPRDSKIARAMEVTLPGKYALRIF